MGFNATVLSILQYTTTLELPKTLELDYRFWNEANYDTDFKPLGVPIPNKNITLNINFSFVAEPDDHQVF